MTIFHTISLGALLLVGGAHAHMTLHDPVPFSPKPDNSPLSPGGQNYPCKMAGTPFQVNTVTKATVGQPLQLSFDGSANHAGGSCQVSLTKDGAAKLNPSSQFKVIYSIMGGCPGTNGNNNKYQVNIPKEVPSGDYTLAWTWFNNIGNREMYMNCAPVSVSGSSGSDGAFNSLPDMAIYNIASKNDCKTTETKDVQFPNPGKYVEIGPGAKLAPPTGSCASGGSGSGGSPPASFPGLGSGAGQDAGSGSGTSGANNGLYTPQASASARPVVPVAAPTATAAPPPVASAPAAPPAPHPSAAPDGFISSPNGQICPTDGALICHTDGTKFGLCNFGRVRFMPVAAGTQCKNGSIVRRSVFRA